MRATPQEARRPGGAAASTLGAARPGRRASRCLAALALLLALALPGAPRAAERLDLWVEAGGGADTNPDRLAGAAPSGHGFASLLGRARLRLDGEGWLAVVTWSEAGRSYQGEGGADAVASRLEGSGRVGLGAGITAALAAAASDTTTRDGRLDRHALRAEAALAFARGGLDAALAGGWSLFAPRVGDLRPFRSSGPEAWLRLGWAPAEAHRVAAAAGLSRAGFPGWSALGATASPTRRDDGLHLAADWSWRGPALLSAGWAFTGNRSGAQGGDFTRHRLTASGAVPLPLDLTLAARLALQWTRYPDPLLLDAQQRLAEGQESLDSAEARLTRPLAGPLEAILSLAWYHARGSGEVPRYDRAVATLGVGWRAGFGER